MFVYPFFGSSVAAPPVAQDWVMTKGTTTTTLSANAPAGIQAGDFLIIGVCAEVASGGAFTDFAPAPAGWTQLCETQTSLTNVVVYYKIAAGGESAQTLTVTDPITTDIVAYYGRLTGVDATEPFNSVHMYNDTGPASPYSPAGSGGLATHTNCLGISFYTAQVTGDIGITQGGTGWTQVRTDRQASCQAALATASFSSVGSQNDPSWSWTGGNSDSALLTLALNPAAPSWAGPVIEDYVLTEDAVLDTSMTAIAPSGISSGDLLVLLVANGDGTTGDVLDTPAGWTKVAEAGDALSDCHSAIFYKVASGSEGNVALTFTNSSYGLAYYLRVSGANTLGVSAEGNYTAAGDKMAFSAVVPTTAVANSLMLGIVAHNGRDEGYHMVYGNGPWIELDKDTAAGGTNDASTIAFFGRMPNAGMAAGNDLNHGVISNGDGRAMVMASFHNV